MNQRFSPWSLGELCTVNRIVVAPPRQYSADNGGRWRASAFTLGVVGGYLAYGIVHHAVHHWPADYAWLRRRRLWHAMHHHRQPPQRFGVSSGFWDRVFGTAGVPR